MKQIHLVMCWRAGALEYPVTAFSDLSRAEIYAGWMNRGARPLCNYRVTSVPLDRALTPALKAVATSRDFAPAGSRASVDLEKDQFNF